MDPNELDRLEQELRTDRTQTPPFNAGGAGRDDAAEPDSDQQLVDGVPDYPSKDTNVDETEFYNEGDDLDNVEADETELPDVDSHEDPAKQ